MCGVLPHRVYSRQTDVHLPQDAKCMQSKLNGLISWLALYASTTKWITSQLTWSSMVSWWQYSRAFYIPLNWVCCYMKWEESFILQTNCHDHGVICVTLISMQTDHWLERCEEWLAHKPRLPNSLNLNLATQRMYGIVSWINLHDRETIGFTLSWLMTV